MLYVTEIKMVSKDSEHELGPTLKPAVTQSYPVIKSRYLVSNDRTVCENVEASFFNR